MTILQKGKVRKVLEQNKILVKDNYDGSLDIYVEDDRIAYWEQPRFRLHIDRSKLNKKDQQYVEIEFSCWSVFDGDNNGTT